MFTDGSGLNPKQKGMLRSIFRRITGKMTGESEKDFVLDPEDKNFGALVEEVEAADEYYGTPPRAFYNKRSKDKRGRMYDLATGVFDLEELARQYPGKKNQGFRREVQALAVDERFTLTTFVNNRNEIIEDWFDGLEAAKDLYDDPCYDTNMELKVISSTSFMSFIVMIMLIPNTHTTVPVTLVKITKKNSHTST